MSKLRIYVMAVGIGLVSSGALAQDAPPRSPDDFVCELTGVCGDESTEPEQTRVVEATKGFDLVGPARRRAPSAAAANAVVAPAPVQQRVQRATSSNRARAQRPTAAPSRMAAENRRPAPVAAIGRTDLRLSFLVGSADLTEQARAQAQSFAVAMQRPELATARVRIEGHTDSQGGREPNLLLSQRRAETVAAFLAAQGVDRQRLDVQGLAYDQPLAGRRASDPANRRVEAVLVR